MTEGMQGNGSSGYGIFTREVTLSDILARDIPCPRAVPFLGHIHLLRPGRFVQDLVKLAEQFPGLFSLRIGSRPMIIVTSAALVAELSHGERFHKVLGRALEEFREIVGDGLITARSGSEAWAVAHRVLRPAFGQRAMRGYFPMMLEVVDRLCLKWTREASYEADVSADMSRLTLETVSLAGFGTSLGSFADNRQDSFLGAVERLLSEATIRVGGFGFLSKMKPGAAAARVADFQTMNSYVDGIVAERRSGAPGGDDMLALMLDTVDPETGLGLSDLNIREQILTFLIAGHETTGALLTFALHFLVTHPAVLAQAYAEVDRVLPGATVPEYAHMARLDVIGRVLKETLRLYPTAPIFVVAPSKNEDVGGHSIRKNERLFVLVPALHRDPAAWSAPETFDIDRFLPEVEAKRSPDAYKPFGNGIRACIGRDFALLESKLTIAAILQRFSISVPRPYKLKVQETVTLKPKDVFLTVRARRAHERIILTSPLLKTRVPVGRVRGDGTRFNVRYGTRSGVSAGLAERIGAAASSFGFKVSVGTLDDLVAAPITSGILVIITATYDGMPPDTALTFAKAVTRRELGDLTGITHAVLGCGNSLWVTYQAFPRAVDEALTAAGSRSRLPRAEADANGDFEAAVERWVDGLWASFKTDLPTTQSAPSH